MDQEDQLGHQGRVGHLHQDCVGLAYLDQEHQAVLVGPEDRVDQPDQVGH